MSELLNTNDNGATIRWKLLTSVSALALAVTVVSPGTARAEETDRPLVWVEIGGQLSRLQDKQEIYSPPFLALEPSQFTSPLKALQPPRYGLDTSGSISFQPQDSNWIFSASIRYGRSGSNNHFHQQSYPLPQPEKNFTGTALVYPLAEQFIDAKTKNGEDNTVLDFQTGRDVGIGVLGHDVSSSLNLGVRIAQFRSKSTASLHEDPTWHFVLQTIFQFGSKVLQGVAQPYETHAGMFEAERSFHGVGPSLSWKGSTPFAGNTQDGALTLDWGVNASLLFGRQSTRTKHYETAQIHHPKYGLFDPPQRVALYHHPATASAYHSTRLRNVTVPNVGGSVGLSWRLQDFKMSLGYRADFFFGAIDGGIDTAKKENRGFYGPYASISIGLGD